MSALRKLDELREVVASQALDVGEPPSNDYAQTCALQLLALATVATVDLTRALVTQRARDLPDWLIHREAKHRMMLPSDHEMPEPTGD